MLTEIGVLYLKINDSQKAFARLSEVIALDRKCPKGLLAYGAILQVFDAFVYIKYMYFLRNKIIFF